MSEFISRFVRDESGATAIEYGMVLSGKNLQDIKASKEEIKGGIQSLSEKIRERGYDPDEVFAEMASDRQKLAKLGIKVDTDIANGQGKPAAADPADKSADAEDPADPAAGGDGKDTTES